MSYTPLRTPFLNMSFTPDVPSNALGPERVTAMENEVDMLIAQAAIPQPQPAPLPWGGA